MIKLFIKNFKHFWFNFIILNEMRCVNWRLSNSQTNESFIFKEPRVFWRGAVVIMHCSWNFRLHVFSWDTYYRLATVDLRKEKRRVSTVVIATMIDNYYLTIMTIIVWPTPFNLFCIKPLIVNIFGKKGNNIMKLKYTNKQDIQNWSHEIKVRIGFIKTFIITRMFNNT